MNTGYAELPKAPISNDYRRIPLAVIYPNDGIEFIMIHTDADGEWSKSMRTGDDLGTYEYKENEFTEVHTIQTKLEILGWEVLIDE